MNNNVKMALVTGGSRGIGRSTVLEFAKNGTDVIFTYNSNQAEADKVVREVNQSGRKAIALQLNITDSGSFDQFAQTVAETLTQFGRDKLDILINNAGTSHHNKIMTTTEEELDTLYKVHLKGVFFLTQKIAPLIKDGGCIINTSTGLTRFTVPESGAYASVKAAVEILTKYLAQELGDRQIRVNVVAPGPIMTDFSGGAVRDNKELNALLSSKTALGHVGSPEDVAKATVALASASNGFVTAQRIEVSGGIFL